MQTMDRLHRLSILRRNELRYLHECRCYRYPRLRAHVHDRESGRRLSEKPRSRQGLHQKLVLIAATILWAKREILLPLEQS